MTVATDFTTGYAQVNGLNMYYEVHGAGRPLVLLHGGLLTIGLSFGELLPVLAASRQVIAVELQGHGHTADTEREFRLDHLAEDVACLLDQLGIERADLFGFSLGGLVALQFAIAHPERTGRLVLASMHYRADGFHEEILDPSQYATSTRMPTGEDFQEMRAAYDAVAPDPGHFDQFAAKASAIPGSVHWPAESLRAITAPTLLLLGDHDFVRIEHAAEMHDLIPDARLGIFPGTKHMEVVRRTELLLPILTGFLPTEL